MGPFFGGHGGHDRCLEVAHTAPSSEPHSRPNRRPGAAASAPTPACLRSTDRTLWGSAGGVLYLLARLGSWAIDLVPSRHPYVARRARARRLCQEWGAQTGPAGADCRIRAIEESISTKAQKQASASVRLRVFYWLVRGIFVSRRELSNKVTWGYWDAKWDFPVGARVAKNPRFVLILRGPRVNFL